MLRRALAGIGLIMLGGLAAGGPDASALILTLEAPQTLSVSDESGSFSLDFPSFLKGTISTPQSVVYRIQANNLMAGTIQGAVSARLDEAVEGLDLEADVQSYQNQGDSNFATLQETQSGFRVIPAGQSVPLADKASGNGSGDALLDGTLTITWRGRLTADAPAGQKSRFLVVTIREGN